jgi:hypothetical protein
MKKLLVCIVAVVMLITAMAGTAFAAETEINEVPDIKIIMGGSRTSYKNVTINIKGSNLLPLREMLVNLGVPNDDDHIIYDGKEKSVTVIMGDTTLLLYIGKNEAYVDGKPIALNAPPVLYNNSTYIPLRFVAEALGKEVVWDGASRTVLISDKEQFAATKQLLEKNKEATAKFDKYKMDMDISATAGDATVKVTFNIKAATALDMANKKMYMSMVMDMLGMEISTDMYYSDNTSYTSGILTEGWQKQTFTEKEYEILFETQSNTALVDATDSLCAGLSQMKSENENEIVLGGDVYIADLYASALAQQGGLLGSTQQDIPKFDTFKVKMTIDKETNLMKNLTMDVTAEQDVDGENITIDLKMYVVFKEYGGDFEIVVPEDVIKNAVDVSEVGGSTAVF